MRGFSLIEALITITVVGVVSMGVLTLINRAYQGSNKTELISNVKQNGQVVLDKLNQVIRNSDTVLCTSSSPYPAVAVKTKEEGKIIRFFISPQTAGSSPQNGYIASQQFDAILNPNTSDFCGFISPFTPTSPAQTKITNDSSSGVSVKSGSFTVSKNPGFKDTLSVIFDIGPSVFSGTNFDSNLGSSGNSVTFQTSIQLR